MTAVLDGLGENPALPPEFIRRMFAHKGGRRTAAGRSDLTRAMVAEILASDDRWLIHALACNWHLDHPTCMRLAESTDPAVRATVVSRARDAEREFFELLINDVDGRVRSRLAESVRTPDDLRARLAADPDPGVRIALAQWWVEAPEAIRRVLLTDPEPEVRAAACSTYYCRLPHPIPPTDLVPMLLADPVTRVGAVRHVNLDGDTARELARDRDYEVRCELAEHPDLTPELREVLARDSSFQVRLHIFARQDTPEAMRAAIHAELAQCGPEREFADWLAGNEIDQVALPWVTADPVSYVESPYTAFRLAAAGSDQLPPHLVTRLLNDDDSGVRVRMAMKTPHLVDLATAERIDREYRPRPKTADRPADHFTFPPETLRRLAGDADPRMRCLAPRDPDLPADLAAGLATDPEQSVRNAVAQHPNLPTEYLVALLDDPSERVASAAAGSPFLPVEEMERLLALAGL